MFAFFHLVLFFGVGAGNTLKERELRRFRSAWIAGRYSLTAALISHYLTRHPTPHSGSPTISHPRPCSHYRSLSLTTSQAPTHHLPLFRSNRLGQPQRWGQEQPGRVRRQRWRPECRARSHAHWWRADGGRGGGWSLALAPPQLWPRVRAHGGVAGRASGFRSWLFYKVRWGCFFFRYFHLFCSYFFLK